MEEWRDIPGYEGSYQVSNIGRVRSLDRFDNVGNKRHGKIKKPYFHKDGYHMIDLSINGKKIHKYIHDLVAIAFLGNKPTSFTVNHKDGIKSNNTPANLEYVTFGDNMKHAKENGLIKKGENHHNSILTDTDVIEIKQRILKGEKNKHIADLFNVKSYVISCIRRNINWKHVSAL